MGAIIMKHMNVLNSLKVKHLHDRKLPNFKKGDKTKNTQNHQINEENSMSNNLKCKQFKLASPETT